jgi:hypothetical protein
MKQWAGVMFNPNLQFILICVRGSGTFIATVEGVEF